jgi:hypothetical protein
MYYPDQESLDFPANLGFKSRFEIFKDSTWVEMMAPVHADLFMQERYLINQCDLRIELYRNGNNFCLMDGSKNEHHYKLEIKQMCMFMKKVEVSDGINLAIESMLQNTTVKYPIRRTQITSLHITENRRSTPLNSLFSGSLPRRIVVGMVAAESARGSYKKSPFDFRDFGISEIKITSGSTTVPSTPYKLDFDSNRFIKAYVQLFEGMGVAGEDKGNAIKLKSFKKGSTFFV